MRVFETHAELSAEMKNPNGFRFSPEHGPAGFRCSVCKEVKPLNTGEGNRISVGYARDRADNLVCYECAGDQEAADLTRTGKGCLYLSIDRMGRPGEGFSARVTNWPGTMSFPVKTLSKGRHNMARVRYDVTFKGPDGADWYGTQYGDFSQICHVRRKARPHAG